MFSLQWDNTSGRKLPSDDGDKIKLRSFTESRRTMDGGRSRGLGGECLATTRVGSVEYLDKVRTEREQEEEIKRLEDERLQEIISFCEKYNEQHQVPVKTTFSDVFPIYETIASHKDNNNEPTNPVSSPGAFCKSLPATTTTYKELIPNTAELISSSDNSDSQSSPAREINGCHHLDEDEESSSDTLTKDANGSSETLNALIMEGALLQGELEQMQSQKLSDTEDEELREFQKIEREIKFTEIMKCLDTIQMQIKERKESSNVEEVPETIPNTVAQSQPNNAPLATAESSDSEDDTIDGAETCDELSCDDMVIPRGPLKKQKASSLPPNEIYSVRSRSLCDKAPLKHQRSLTLFVPSTSAHDDNGLTAHLTNLGHDLPVYSDYLQVTCCTCSGYLWKLCSKSQNKWKKRFFHFDRHYKVFFYYKSHSQFKKVKKPSGGVYFDEIRDVYIDRARTKRTQQESRERGSTLLRRKPTNARCVFVVETAKRQFILSTFVWEVMRIWVDVVFTGAESYFD